MKLIKIIAAIVSTQQLTLYKEDGTTEVIQQGDIRIHPIIDTIAVPMAQNGFAWMDESLLYVPEPVNQFKEFENQSGVVKFWKIAKSKLKSFFGETTVEPVEPMVLGSVPADKKLAAIQDVMAHAVSASDPKFNMENIQKQRETVNEEGKTNSKDHTEEHEDVHSHTLVAEVNGKLIPGVEKIQNQFANAIKMGSAKGVENFLARITAVIDQRRHSVADLLRFMERADLPIADDGSIVIYKVLRKRNDHYVDCHTNQVKQKIGSYVCMDASMVDHDRRTECSNGLHVARRGYIGSFGGDVCVIAKLAPEDVIAVPEYDANKMRVCGYHILHELSESQYLKLRNNQKITDDEEGRNLLGRIIAGNHIGKLEEVRIHGSKGTNLKITPYEQAQQPEVVAESVEVIPMEALEVTKEGDLEIAPPVDLVKVTEVAKVGKPPSKREKAQELLNKFKGASTATVGRQVAIELVALKKEAKKSWDTLGINEVDATRVQKAAE